MNENNWIFSKTLWAVILLVVILVACDMWLWETTFMGACVGVGLAAILYGLLYDGLPALWRSFWQMEKQDDE